MPTKSGLVGAQVCSDGQTSECVCGWLPLPCCCLLLSSTTVPPPTHPTSNTPSTLTGVIEYGRTQDASESDENQPLTGWSNMDYIGLLQFECWPDCQRMIPLP